MSNPRKVSTQEVAKHNRGDDLWTVVNGVVYDMTSFANEHPGGSAVIHRYAGKDASEEYNGTHSKSLIQEINNHRVGDLDTTTITEEWAAQSTRQQQPRTDTDTNRKPTLGEIINLDDFEHASRTTFPAKAWAYISGAANDNLTRDANRAVFQRVWFRPAIMRNVAHATTKTTLFGCDLSIPVYITPVGAVKTAHEDGELAFARAAAATGIVHGIATPSSYPLQEILDETPERAFYQLYINKDRSKTETLVRQAVASGKVKALFVTVDLPVMSKREEDERVNAETSSNMVYINQNYRDSERKTAGLARSTATFIDPTLNWDDLRWLRGLTDLPLVLKGVQRVEDARIAAELGFDGIVVSNHGGRAADTAQPALLTLLEIRRYAPEVFQRMKVLVDGGFRRGSDVVKAICLGAAAVGLGRPFLFALNYGQEGVEHAVHILQDEIATAMQLNGLTDLMRDASPRYLNTAALEPLLPPDYDRLTGTDKSKL